MPRQVEEWVGAHPDSKVPERVQLRVWRRQTDAEGVVHCAISGDPIYPGDDVQLDHRTPLILLGEHKESNLQFVLTRYHRLKTAEEVAIRSGNDARAKTHAGIKTTELTGLEGRTPQQKRAAKARKSLQAGKLAMPAPRRLFVDQKTAPAPLQIGRRS